MDINRNKRGPHQTEQKTQGQSDIRRAAQRGCAVFILGGFQDLTGLSPVQPGQTKALLRFLPTSVTLRSKAYTQRALSAAPNRAPPSLSAATDSLT